jgi:hypothetical protein
MQPKPIEARHLLDIDTRNRLVDTETIQYLRAVREHKQHPEETDYNIIHDEVSRRNREENARGFAEQQRRNRAEYAKNTAEPAKESLPEDEQNTPTEEKGSHLDVKA